MAMATDALILGSFLMLCNSVAGNSRSLAPVASSMAAALALELFGICLMRVWYYFLGCFWKEPSWNNWINWHHIWFIVDFASVSIHVSTNRIKYTVFQYKLLNSSKFTMYYVMRLCRSTPRFFFRSTDPRPIRGALRSFLRKERSASKVWPASGHFPNPLPWTFWQRAKVTESRKMQKIEKTIVIACDYTVARLYQKIINVIS